MAAVFSRTPAQLFSLVAGAVYVLIGILGFAVTGLSDFTGEGGDLVIFPVNPLHNIVHVALGAVWLIGSRENAAAKAANLGIGLVYGLVTILGSADLLGFLNIDDLGSPDNFLHLISAGLALYFGTAGAERASARTS